MTTPQVVQIIVDVAAKSKEIDELVRSFKSFEKAATSAANKNNTAPILESYRNLVVLLEKAKTAQENLAKNSNIVTQAAVVGSQRNLNEEAKKLQTLLSNITPELNNKPFITKLNELVNYITNEFNKVQQKAKETFDKLNTAQGSNVPKITAFENFEVLLNKLNQLKEKLLSTSNLPKILGDANLDNKQSGLEKHLALLKTIEKSYESLKNKAANALRTVDANDITQLEKLRSELEQITKEQNTLNEGTKKVQAELKKVQDIKLANKLVKVDIAVSAEQLDKIKQLNLKKGEFLNTRTNVKDARSLVANIDAEIRSLKQAKAELQKFSSVADEKTKNAVQTQLTLIQDRIKTFQDLKKSFETLVNEKTNLPRSIASANEEVIQLNKSFKETKKALKDLNTRVGLATTSKEVVALEKERIGIARTLSNILKESAALQERLNGLQIQANKQGVQNKPQVKTLNQIITELQQVINEQNTIAEKVKGTKDRFVQVERAIAGNVKQLNNFKEVLSGVETTFSGLGGTSALPIINQISALNAGLRTTTLTIAEIDKRINSLKKLELLAKSAESKAIINTLISGLDDLKTKAEQLKSIQISTLGTTKAKKVLEDLENKFKTTKTNIEVLLTSLQNKLQTFGGSINVGNLKSFLDLESTITKVENRLKSSIEKAQEFIDKLRASKADNTLITALEQQLTTLQNQLQSTVTGFETLKTAAKSLNISIKVDEAIAKAQKSVADLTADLATFRASNLTGGKKLSLIELDIEKQKLKELEKEAQQTFNSIKKALANTNDPTKRTQLLNLGVNAQQIIAQTKATLVEVKDLIERTGPFEFKIGGRSLQLALRTLTEEGALLSGTMGRVALSFAKAFGVGSQQAIPLLNAARELEKQLVRVKSVIITMAFGLQMLGQAVSDPLKVAITATAEFTDIIAMAGNIASATASEFAALAVTARIFGATTRYTTVEAATGLQNLTRAGFTALEAIKGLPVVLNLAQASATDLGRSAEIVTQIMHAFKISVEDLGVAADVIAKAANTSNATVEKLGSGFVYVGSIAKSLGDSFEDVIGAMAKLNSAGFVGTLAGTALRGALDGLFNPTKDEARVMGELSDRIGGVGLQLKNSAGQFVGFVSLVKQLEAAGFTAEEALRLFGQRAGPGMAALVGIGGEALEKYVEELKHSEGTTARLGEKMVQTLKGTALIFTSALEALGEGFGHNLESSMISIISGLTSLVNGLISVREAFHPVTVIVDHLIAGFGALIAAVGGLTFAWFLMIVPAAQFLSFLNIMISLLAQIASSMFAAATANTAYAAANAAATVSTQTLLTTMIAGNATLAAWTATLYTFSASLSHLGKSVLTLASLGFVGLTASIVGFLGQLYFAITGVKSLATAQVAASLTAKALSFAEAAYAASTRKYGSALLTLNAAQRANTAAQAALTAATNAQTGATARSATVQFFHNTLVAVGTFLSGYYGLAVGLTAAALDKYTASALAASYSTATLTKWFGLARLGLLSLFKVLLTNPWGLLILGLGSAYLLYNKFTDATAQASLELAKQGEVIKSNTTNLDFLIKKHIDARKEFAKKLEEAGTGENPESNKSAIRKDFAKESFADVKRIIETLQETGAKGITVTTEFNSKGEKQLFAVYKGLKEKQLIWTESVSDSISEITANFDTFRSKAQSASKELIFKNQATQVEEFIDRIRTLNDELTDLKEQARRKTTIIQLPSALAPPTDYLEDTQKKVNRITADIFTNESKRKNLITEIVESLGLEGRNAEEIKASFEEITKHLSANKKEAKEFSQIQILINENVKEFVKVASDTRIINTFRQLGGALTQALNPLEELQKQVDETLKGSQSTVKEYLDSLKEQNDANKQAYEDRKKLIEDEAKEKAKAAKDSLRKVIESFQSQLQIAKNTEADRKDANKISLALDKASLKEKFKILLTSEKALRRERNKLLEQSLNFEDEKLKIQVDLDKTKLDAELNVLENQLRQYESDLLSFDVKFEGTENLTKETNKLKASWENIRKILGDVSSVQSSFSEEEIATARTNAQNSESLRQKRKAEVFKEENAKLSLMFKGLAAFMSIETQKLDLIKTNVVNQLSLIEQVANAQIAKAKDSAEKVGEVTRGALQKQIEANKSLLSSYTNSYNTIKAKKLELIQKLKQLSLEAVEYEKSLQKGLEDSRAILSPLGELQAHEKAKQALLEKQSQIEAALRSGDLSSAEAYFNESKALYADFKSTVDGILNNSDSNNKTSAVLALERMTEDQKRLNGEVTKSLKSNGNAQVNIYETMLSEIDSSIKKLVSTISELSEKLTNLFTGESLSLEDISEQISKQLLGNLPDVLAAQMRNSFREALIDIKGLQGNLSDIQPDFQDDPNYLRNEELQKGIKLATLLYEKLQLVNTLGGKAPTVQAPKAFEIDNKSLLDAQTQIVQLDKLLSQLLDGNITELDGVSFINFLSSFNALQESLKKANINFNLFDNVDISNPSEAVRTLANNYFKFQESIDVSELEQYNEILKNTARTQNISTEEVQKAIDRNKQLTEAQKALNAAKSKLGTTSADTTKLTDENAALKNVAGALKTLLSLQAQLKEKDSWIGITDAESKEIGTAAQDSIKTLSDVNKIIQESDNISQKFKETFSALVISLNSGNIDTAFQKLNAENGGEDQLQSLISLITQIQTLNEAQNSLSAESKKSKDAIIAQTGTFGELQKSLEGTLKTIQTLFSSETRLNLDTASTENGLRNVISLLNTINTLNTGKDQTQTISVTDVPLTNSTQNLVTINTTLNTNLVLLKESVVNLASKIGNILGAKTGGLITSFGVKRFSTGGKVPGMGSGDKVPALLEPGEFVIKKSRVSQFGFDFFKNLNEKGQLFSLGGLVADPSSLFSNFQRQSPFSMIQSENIKENVTDVVEVKLSVGNKTFPVKSARNQVNDLVSAFKSLERGLAS